MRIYGCDFAAWSHQDAGQMQSMIEVCEEHLDIRVWDKRLSLTGW
jgi:hypothetical protein